MYLLDPRSIFPKLSKDWKHICDDIVLSNIVCVIRSVDIGHINTSRSTSLVTRGPYRQQV